MNESENLTFSPSGNNSAAFLGGDFSVDLGFFNGPLDLLLHLVRHHEVSASKVDMKVVCERYLDIVLKAQNLDLERAAEFLVIASTLVALKSQSLLPSSPNIEDLSGELPSSEFYEQLRRRLIEYELTKERASLLAVRPQLGHEIFIRKDRSALTVPAEQLEPVDDAFSLASMFGRLLKRIGETGRTMRIRFEPVSVTQFMVSVLDSFTNALSAGVRSNSGPKKKSFLELLRQFRSSGKKANGSGSDQLEGVRGTIIGSFVAVLELMKRGLVRADQLVEDGEISIELRMKLDGEMDLNNFQSGAMATSEFDVPSGEGADSRVINLAEYREGIAVSDLSFENGHSVREDRMEVNKRG